MSDNGMINEKLDSLLQGVSENYGKILLDELTSRLENTIADFNEEIEAIMIELKENASLKEKMIADIKAGKTNEKIPNKPSANSKDERKISEWEKRLEKLSN